MGSKRRPALVWLAAQVALTLGVAGRFAMPQQAELRPQQLPRVVLNRQYRVEQAGVLPRAVKPSHVEVRRAAYSDFDAYLWELSAHAPSGESITLRAPAFQFVVCFPEASQLTAYGCLGSRSRADDFRPMEEVLAPGKALRFASAAGRSSDAVLPYFNLAAAGGGVIVAVGWSGDWQARFRRVDGHRVQVEAQLQRPILRLRAGEQLQLPSLLLMAYKGRWIHGQNRFRRLMVDRLRPPPLDMPLLRLMPVAASVHGETPFNATSEQQMKDFVQRVARTGLPVDTVWLDAGWNLGGFPRGQGNIEPDPLRFPNGLAPVGRAVHKQKYRFLVWFEPERVMGGTWLDRTHPGWLLRPLPLRPEYRYLVDDEFRLLDLGKEAVRDWLFRWLANQIQTIGIDILRLDCNLPPAPYWDAVASEPGDGTAEVRHVSGLYWVLDQLRTRYPRLIIDICAQGGRRLDFEILRRGVPLWRSDSCWDDPAYPRNVQAMAYGLSLWLPLHGLGAASTDTVALRSGMGACVSFPINYRAPRAVEALRRHLRRYLAVRELFLGDFYPLTAWSLDPHRWLAYQYHQPERGRGLVLAFANSPQESTIIRLQGLRSEAKYAVSDWDHPDRTVFVSGADLAAKGLVLPAVTGPQARVWEYRELRP